MTKQRFLKALIFTPLVLMIFGTQAWATWMIDTVHEGKYFNVYRSIALDSSGNPHIAYGGDRLYHAYFDGSVWQYEMIDSTPGVGEKAWIAIDASDAIHIVYRDHVTSYLKYATNASGSWQIETFYSFGKQYYLAYPVAVEASGTVHLFLSDYNTYELKYLKGHFGSWTIQSSPPGTPKVLALDSSGNAHIQYSTGYPDDNQMYATNFSGSWVSEALPDYRASSMDIDSSGKVHLSCYHRWERYLVHLTNASGSWEVETVDGSVVMSGASIALDGSDTLHIAYYDEDNGNLKYARGSWGSWAFETVDDDPGDVGSSPSLGVTPSGNVHISYYDKDNGAVKYAVGTSGSWAIQTVESGSTDLGWFPDIAVDPSGTIHVSYLDEAKNDNIMYATGSYGSWTTETAGPGGVRIDSKSMSVDSAGNAHISYYDGNLHLKYLTNTSGSWITETLGTGTHPYWEWTNSIAVDSLNRAHIVYEQSIEHETVSPIKYLTNASDSWEASVTLDSNGTNPHIAIDSSNKVHIIYYDGDTEGLVHITNVSGSWVSEPVVTPNKWPFYISMDVDTSGNVHVAYNDAASDWSEVYLKYATNASGTWLTETVTTEGFDHPHIAVDSSNKVHISYAGWESGQPHLKCATGSYGTWAIETVDSSGTFTINDIAVDSSDNVHIAYHDKANRDVKYATTSPTEEHGPDGNDPTYDGNGDGTPDSQQDNVTSFHTYDRLNYVTLESPDGTTVQNVEPVDNPSPINTPEGIEFPYGFFKFTITGVAEGGATTVTLHLPAACDTYYKYGPTPNNPDPHWYEFDFDDTTGTGAVFSGNIVTLHFVDGQRGDHDLTANGTIVEPGAPGVGGIPGDLDGDGDVDRNDLNIILAARNTPADGPDDPKDLDGDGMITALDARKLVLLCTCPRCVCP